MKLPDYKFRITKEDNEKYTQNDDSNVKMCVLFEAKIYYIVSVFVHWWCNAIPPNHLINKRCCNKTVPN